MIRGPFTQLAEEDDDQDSKPGKGEKLESFHGRKADNGISLDLNYTGKKKSSSDGDSPSSYRSKNLVFSGKEAHKQTLAHLSKVLGISDKADDDKDDDKD